ncbi:MAG: helix-turn-helix transcriptional regulator [Victivallales bacterium]|nr:helix-turn-helix transcriptional regulator [Victivallales bacterium]
MPANNEVGAKIKGLRELRGVTLEELSERCGLAADQIEKIESGMVTTSLTPLLKIARGLGVRLGTFLDDTELSEPVVTRAKAGNVEAVRFAGPTDREGLEFHALAANKRDRNMEPFVIDVHPAMDNKFILSSHEGEEFIYVLSGALEINYGKNTYHIEAGDSIYYDSIVPHHVHAADGKETRILAVIYAPH